MATHETTVAQLTRRLGRTFAEEAGITLRDKPAPLWQLVVLSELLSTPISADVAMATARELWRAGWRTPQKLRSSTWQQRVDALGRGGYRRYDESTATRLAECAELLQERWHGDLRRLRDEAAGDPQQISQGLQSFKGIGAVGADIFLREVQAVWPEVRPRVDALVCQGAELAGLPQDAHELAKLNGDEDLSRLAAALVRVARDPELVGDEKS